MVYRMEARANARAMRLCVCLSARPSVRVVDYALSVALKAMPFGMHIHIMARSDKGYIILPCRVFKDHL